MDGWVEAREIAAAEQASVDAVIVDVVCLVLSCCCCCRGRGIAVCSSTNGRRAIEWGASRKRIELCAERATWMPHYPVAGVVDIDRQQEQLPFSIFHLYLIYRLLMLYIYIYPPGSVTISSILLTKTHLITPIDFLYPRRRPSLSCFFSLQMMTRSSQ